VSIYLSLQQQLKLEYKRTPGAEISQKSKQIELPVLDVAAQKSSLTEVNTAGCYLLRV